MTEKSLPDICVVTQPIGDSDPTATQDLLAILDAITTVSLVTIALPADSDLCEEYEVVEISSRGLSDSVVLSALYFLYNQLRMALVLTRREEEVVLFYGSMAYTLPILVARLTGTTVVTEPRADVAQSLRLQWERKLPPWLARGLAGLVGLLIEVGYRLSHAIITYTPGMATELGVDRYEHKLYPHGARFVDTEQFTVETPYPERPQTIGYVGRLAEEKGIRTLAAVAKQLPDGVTFRFVGDGPLREYLEAELHQEIAAGTVEITGWVDHDEIHTQFNELRLLVLASEPTEGLPTVILEAMACGVPVMATPVSGVPDVIQDGDTGYLIWDRSTEAISKQIQSHIEESDLETTSEGAVELIRGNYTFHAAVKRYETLLRHICS